MIVRLEGSKAALANIDAELRAVSTIQERQRVAGCLPDRLAWMLRVSWGEKTRSYWHIALCLSDGDVLHASTCIWQLSLMCFVFLGMFEPHWIIKLNYNRKTVRRCEEELPEKVIGAIRLINLDLDKAEPLYSARPLD